MIPNSEFPDMAISVTVAFHKCLKVFNIKF